MPERYDEAARAAALILDSFLDYHERFADITRRARRRFELRDWKLSPLDAASRIDLSRLCLDEGLARLDRLADERIRAGGFWAQMKAAFAVQTAALPDRALARTWFSSLSRRQFHTEGVAGTIEFTANDMGAAGAPTVEAMRHAYAVEGDLAGAFERVFDQFAFRNDYADSAACARRVAQALGTRFADWPIDAIEFLHHVFFRERRGYLVGRVRLGDGWHPLVIALVSSDEGVLADAVLTDKAQIGVLFGYTRSYFQVDLDRVAATVAFLHALMPSKPIDELYTVLGRARHGKTERYRALAEHLTLNPDERLVRADGERGMVMAVFTCSAYPLVFKVIRDHFAYPKTTTRQDIEDKYRLVFHHDRVGRLVDAQEYRQLRFPLARFEADMLDELVTECANAVRIENDEVVIKHCYVERCIRPLNLYVREAADDDARRAIIDYGQAIKDLARSNIFPGDLLLKNFGVARSGRAVFYDYDELCLVSECRFRHLPEPREGDETRPVEDYVSFSDNDVFPEQFPRFLGVPARLRDALLQRHPEIFDADWWRSLQEGMQHGDWIDVPPYPSTARLSREPN
ncbi:MAG: bifunctional isocitrate dehydrogenase kinase/phosphatase [Dokdonella sp.]